MSGINRFKNYKKNKNYSKYRIVSWKILSKIRKKPNNRFQKSKWRFLRYSLLNMTGFVGRNQGLKRKKFLGLKSHFKEKEDFRIKPKVSCLKKTYRDSLNEIRKIRSFFGLIKIKVIKKKLSKYLMSKRSREKLLINFLESRLDVVLYRMGFSSSVLESVRLIRKGFVLVNNSVILKRNYQLNSGDLVKIIFSKKDKSFFSRVSNIQNKLPSYLEVNYKTLEGIFVRKPLKKELMYPEVFCFNTALRRLKKR